MDDISHTDTPEDSADPLDPDERSTVDRILLYVALLLLIAVISVGLGIVWYVRTIDAPRSAPERDVVTYRVAVKENPEVLDNHLQLAYAYAKAGRIDDAQESLARASGVSDSAIVVLGAVGAHDFTTAATGAYPGDDTSAQKELESGVFGMFASDGTVDGQITASDFDLWLVDTKAVATGYLQSDYDLDTQVTASDFNLWLVNTKSVATSKVP